MRAWIAIAAVAASGCSVTGTDSKSHFACQAPEGVQCMTASGVYYNSLANNLPGLRPASAAANASSIPSGPFSTAADAEAPRPAASALATSVRPPVQAVGARAPDIAAGEALRSPPRTMRIWLPPWEDADGDLHDQSYLYVTLDAGRWLLDHARSGRSRPKTSATTLLQSDAPPGGEAAASAAGTTLSREIDKLAPQGKTGAAR